MAASQKQPPVGGPVLLDFYADWCAPCKQLTPKLERLVSESQGALRLAKVNVDRLPELSQALQVASLPTVMLVHKGKLVDSFQGVLPDAQLKAFVDKAVELAGGPAGAEKALQMATAAMEEGEVAEATRRFSELLALPEHAATATAGLALCALKDDNLALAQDLVADLHKRFPGDVNKPEVRKAISKVALAADGTGAGKSIDELRAVLGEGPAQHSIRFELAQALVAHEQVEEAVGELLHILKKDRSWNDGAAKNLLLQIFESLGNSHELTKKGRRKLANIVLA